MNKIRIAVVLIQLLMVICLSQNVVGDERRPIYNIAHMVNKISQIKEYLNYGANVIESDVEFYANGSVRRVHHGFPCDCFRTCFGSSRLSEFLNHVRLLTDPLQSKNYANQLVMQFFDLKMKDYNRNKKQSGREIAHHILEYLWTTDGSRKQEVRALVYIEDLKNFDVILGFLEEFKARGKTSRLVDVGFDAGDGNLGDIRRMLNQLPERVNVWQGYGITNCISPVYLFPRMSKLSKAIDVRDSEQGFIQKVYDWTIDLQQWMKVSLSSGVDGIITNDPYDLVEVLKRSDFKKRFRIATPEDDPFAKFIPSSAQGKSFLKELFRG